MLVLITNTYSFQVRSEGEDGQTFPLFTKKGPQGEDWNFGHALVGNDQPYRVSFIATRGGDDKTDIAIDEVSFTYGCAEGGKKAVKVSGTKKTVILLWC